jgi:hypothetical protein
LLGVERAQDALEYLPRGFGEIVVRCCYGPEVSDRPQDGKQPDEF